MGIKSIDARMARKAFLAAAKKLEAKKEWINELNVFPVPDGDTGTNMSLTIMAAAKEVAALEDPTMEQLAKAIASGSLRGARGNSGVILSQLFRGFTKEIKKEEEITTVSLTNALIRATETAYKAVMKPKEGTILTVAKGMADKAAELVSQTEDIVVFADKVIEYGEYVLSRTPEMLPVLKQAGVVDSGGQGLIEVVKGARDGLLGKEVLLEEPLEMEKKTDRVQQAASLMEEGEDRIFSGSEDVDIRYGYCTEFIINLEQKYDQKTEQELKNYLESIGDSIVVVSDEDIVKVHVHTNHPGLAFERALTYGSLSRMKVDNMREEHREKLVKEAQVREARVKEAQVKEMQKKEVMGKESQEEKLQEKKLQEEKHCMGNMDTERKTAGFVAVSMGDGLGEIFRGIGADCLIQGGQTMNPSTEDVLNAISQVNADTVFVFPNNKNIILAAQQAKALCEDKNVVVIPSKTVPQGITAIINYLPDLSAEENVKNMTEEMERVKTAQITYAVRNTTIGGTAIAQGDIMALGDQGILAVGKSVEGTAMDALKKMIDEEAELVTIYYGEDISREEGEHILAMAQEAFPQCEIELHNGGQPVYYYLISVE